MHGTAWQPAASAPGAVVKPLGCGRSHKTQVPGGSKLMGCLKGTPKFQARFGGDENRRGLRGKSTWNHFLNYGKWVAPRGTQNGPPSRGWGTIIPGFQFRPEKGCPSRDTQKLHASVRRPFTSLFVHHPLPSAHKHIHLQNYPASKPPKPTIKLYQPALQGIQCTHRHAYIHMKN